MIRRFFKAVLICTIFFGFAVVFGANSTVCDKCKVPFDGASHLRVPLHGTSHDSCTCTVCQKCLHGLSQGPCSFLRICPQCHHSINASVEKRNALLKVVEEQGRCLDCGENDCICKGGRDYFGKYLVDFVRNMVTTAPLGGFNMLQHLRSSLLFGSLGVGCGIFDFYSRRVIDVKRDDAVSNFCSISSIILHLFVATGIISDLTDNNGRFYVHRRWSSAWLSMGKERAQFYSFAAGFYMPVTFDILRCAHQHRLPSRALAVSWQMIKRAVLKKS